MPSTTPARALRLALAVTLLSALTTLATLSSSCMSGKSSRGKKGSTGNVPGGTSTDTGNGTGTGTETPGGAWTHTALIIDDGFDTSHKVFGTKIVASFTLECNDSDTGSTNGTFEEIKAELIAAYKKNEDACTIKTGISFDLDAKFQTIEDKRDAWNEGLASKDGVNFTESQVESILEVLNGDYHGTNTAGLLAYNNPNIKLVLVQMELRGAGDSPLGLAGECPAQSDIDLWVQLHSDAAVKTAYVEAPLSATDEKLNEIAADNGVTLVNLSLGSSPLPVLEAELAEAGCKNLDFSKQFEIEGELRKERSAYRRQHPPAGPQADVLTVQAAGNDGIQIDSTDVAVDCSDRESDLILVGALTDQRELAEFSNFGKCVDFYVLGQSVVVAAPDNFLNVADGTSFSSPLLVRYLSRRFDPKTKPKEIVAALDEMADANGYLPAETAPSELSFDNKSDAISSYALTQAQAKASAKPRRTRHWRRGLDFGYHRPVRPRVH